MLSFCRLVGSFLNISPHLCFVMEDDEGVFGYALAVSDAKEYHKKVEMAWIPAMKEKYPKPIRDLDLTPAEVICSVNWFPINSFQS